MRVILGALALLSASSVALAQPKTPEHLLPADCLAYFRYDGYEPHRKAYDQTVLAKVMKEGLAEFFDHAMEQVVLVANDGVLRRNAKKGKDHRPELDGLLDSVGKHGFAVAVETSPLKRGLPRAQDPFQLTIVFPEGAEKKNRQALDKFFRMLADTIGAPVEAVRHEGRPGHAAALGEFQAAWWAEGKHFVFTMGVEPAKKALRVIDGDRPNLTSTTWYKEMSAFKRYETDTRGFVDLAAIVDRIAIAGLEEPGLANFKERFQRHLLLSHLGLTGLKDLTFHLGFDGKYQRSTVRVGVVEPDRRAGLLRLVSGPIGLSAGELPKLPPDADYVSVRHVNWNNVLDYVRSSYGMLAVSRLFEGELPARFPDLDRIVVGDVRKDLLDQLDTTVVTYGAHSEGPFFLGQGFTVKVKDAAKVRKSLAAITKALGERDDRLKTEKKAFRGEEMHVFSKLYLPVTYTVHKDWLVVGLFPQAVQGFVLRNGGKYRTWKAPPELEVALAKERKENSKAKLIGMSVSDPRPAVEIGLALLPVWIQILNQSAGTEVFDVSKIPNAQAVNEWLFPNIMLAYDDGNALRMEHQYSINEPDDFLLASVLPYAVSFFDLIPLRFPERNFQAEKLDPLCPATAFEKDGIVQIKVLVSKSVPETEKKKVAYTVIKPITKDGITRNVEETHWKEVIVTKYRTVTESQILLADGKKVQVTRKDGKPVDPKELPKLLEKETQVLLAPNGEIDAEVLRKLDEKTLIIRVPPAQEKGPIDATSKPRNNDDPKRSIPSLAAAIEKDGKIVIQLRVPREVAYDVTRTVRGAFVDETDNAFGDNGPGRTFREGAIFKFADTGTPMQVQRKLVETHYRTIMEPRVLIADGKKVQVARKDGKAVDPEELPKLLEKETQVLLAPHGEIDPEVLRKLDDRTLIIRVAPSGSERLPDPRRKQ